MGLHPTDAGAVTQHLDELDRSDCYRPFNMFCYVAVPVRVRVGINRAVEVPIRAIFHRARLLMEAGKLDG